MRLKHLRGIVLLLLVSSAIAALPASRLTNISVASQGSATTVTLYVNGAFTHNEYRPADTLLLVDLTGVAAGKLDERSHAFNVPGLKGYHVFAYSGAGNIEVTRVELTIEPAATFKVTEIAGGFSVELTGTMSAVNPAESATAESQPQPKAAPAQPSRAQRAVEVRAVSVARSDIGLDVEIAADGPISPKALKLTAPDRVVVDIVNAVPSAQVRPVALTQGALKSVRMGRYQATPPVTRVVMDLESAHDFELVPSTNKVVVRLRPAGAPKVQPAPVKVEPPAPPVELAKAEPPAALPTSAVITPKPEGNVVPAPATPAAQEVKAPARASEFVMVQPTFTPKDTTKAEAPAEPKPAPELKLAKTEIVEPKPASSSDPALPTPSGAMGPRPAMTVAQIQQQQLQPQPQKPRYTGEPISVNLKDVDLKDFFRLIHEISGLNVVLDPSVRGSLTLVLDDVPWDQALDIVLKNNALDRQLEGNVLRIATIDTLRKEADARRAQAEAQALAVDKVTVTRFLSYAHSKDVMPTMKKFLSQRGEIIADERTNALIVQDIPSVIPTIDRLLQQLDRKTQEVEIEARVIAATRNFAREIGTALGFAFANANTSAGGLPGFANLISPIGLNVQPGTTSVQAPTFDGRVKQAEGNVSTTPLGAPGYIQTRNSTAIPLFTNLNATAPTSGLAVTSATGTYRIDAMLSMAESRGLLKILSRPRVVTQNNIQALVRQGLRIPVVTLGQLGGPPTVTYIDAFLRLTVTPQITVENTIFMNLDVENTTPDFGRTVGGNPTLITQQATTQVLVTDGGTVVIGGVIQTQNSVNVAQVPLLGDIPILGNLFKRRSVSTSTQELIFFVTPKIIQT